MRGEEARDRARANSDAVALDQGAADLLQRQIGRLGDQRQHRFAMSNQARAMIAAHGPGLSMPLGAQALRPADRGADADPEPLGGPPGRRTARYCRHHAIPEILRIGSRHTSS